MLKRIIELDTELFVYLNGLGSESYDKLWLVITNQSSWILFFLLLIYIIYKKIGVKQSLYLLLFVAILIAFTDQTTNLFKNGFQRLRPCNNIEINSFIRILRVRKSFSFFSGHAANSMAVATFLFLVFKSKFKYIGFLFLWPLVFAYSRIYLGLHYPVDIICGYICGAIYGFVVFKIYERAQQKYFPVRN